MKIKNIKIKNKKSTAFETSFKTNYFLVVFIILIWIFFIATYFFSKEKFDKSSFDKEIKQYKLIFIDEKSKEQCNNGIYNIDLREQNNKILMQSYCLSLSISN